MYCHDSNIIDSTIHYLTKNSNIRICICDTSGIFSNNEILDIKKSNRIHDSSVCLAAKTTSEGLKKCIKCKSYTIKTARKCNQAFVRKCYLGLTEMVISIYHKTNFLCVVYIGNVILEDDEDSIEKTIIDACEETKVNKDILLKNIDNIDVVNRKALNEYLKMGEILKTVVLANYNKLLEEKHNYTNKRNDNHWVISTIKDEVNSRYFLDIKLSFFSELYFFNTEYLCRLFKKVTGMTFSTYMNNVRIEKAQKLLLETDDSIIDISSQVGYNSVSYFNRQFKKITNTTPINYRNGKRLISKLK